MIIEINLINIYLKPVIKKRMNNKVLIKTMKILKCNYH